MQLQLESRFKVVLRRKDARQYWTSGRVWTTDPDGALTFETVPEAVTFALRGQITDACVAVLDGSYQETLLLPELQ